MDERYYEELDYQYEMMIDNIMMAEDYGDAIWCWTHYPKSACNKYMNETLLEFCKEGK